MNKIILLFLTFLCLLWGSNDMNKSKFYNNDQVSSTTIKENFPNPTNDKNNSKWNIADWNKFFSKKANSNIIGNTQALMNRDFMNKAITLNPENVMTDNIRKDSTLSKYSSIKAWDTKTKDSVVTSTIVKRFTQEAGERDIKCYITRDIAFQYQCTKTGVVYGGDIDQTGLEARKKCEAECYQQFDCIKVVSNKKPDIKLNNIECKDSNCSYKFPINDDRFIKNLTFDVNYSYTKPIYVTIKAITLDGNYFPIVTKLDIRAFKDNNETILPIFNKIKEIEFIINKENKEDNVTISKINLNFNSNGEYICPALQDITYLENVKNNFGYVCPGGVIETYYTKYGIFKICSNSIGDNPDGTFSSYDKCKSACKINYKCIPQMRIFSTNLLRTFREGCIQGQANCKDIDCKIARLTGAPIVNEVVFDATEHATVTVKDGQVIKGVYRPKISVTDDTDYLDRAKEEWKDTAFRDMAENRKYAVSIKPFGEENNASSAYGVEIESGAAYGEIGGVKRVLYWKLKPKTFDVFSNKKFYLYSILVTDVGYYGYDASGKRVRLRKIIWYLKLPSDGDAFKAIRFKDNAGYIDFVNGQFVFKNNISSKYEDDTFTGNNWVSLNPMSYAEYFKTVYFNDTDIYWKFKIINNMGELIYHLPGIIRRRVEVNSQEYDYYTGDFDGTGDGILDYKVYTVYSSHLLTYNDIYNLIDNEKINPIYDMLQPNLYPKMPKSDSVSDKDIKLYIYGPLNKTSVIARIKPDEKDVGKQGFIFVFIQ